MTRFTGLSLCNGHSVITSGRRRAVGDRQDALVLHDVLRVDLRHHQRHVRVHAPDAGVVDDDGAGLGGNRCVVARNLVCCRDEREVAALERGLGQRLDLDVLLSEGNLLAGGPGRGDELERAQRERALSQDVQEDFPDNPRGAHHGYVVALCHHTTPVEIDSPRDSGAAKMITRRVGTDKLRAASSHLLHLRRRRSSAVETLSATRSRLWTILESKLSGFSPQCPFFTSAQRTGAHGHRRRTLSWPRTHRERQSSAKRHLYIESKLLTPLRRGDEWLLA